MRPLIHEVASSERDRDARVGEILRTSGNSLGSDIKVARFCGRAYLVPRSVL